jgi:preprotein translocase subunit SecB
MAEEAQKDTTEREFAVQRMYVKDLSFETPESPGIFKDQWEPDMNLEMHTNSSELEEGAHEVVLSATVTVKSNEKTAFLIEVKYAGIFTIKHFEEEQLGALLGSVCPSIIFPYLREVVSDIVTRGSFPQLILAPVNFDALYAQHLEQQESKKTTDSKEKA